MRIPISGGIALAALLASACNSNNNSSSTGLGTTEGATTQGLTSGSGSASGSASSTGAAAATTTGSITGTATGGSATSGTTTGGSTSGTTTGAPDSGPPSDLPGFYACGCVWPTPFCPADGGFGCQACLADSDCPASAPLCVEGACQGCRTAADCAAGQVCNPFTDVCMSDCRLDGGTLCGQGTTCQMDAGICFSGCASDSDCAGLTFPYCVNGFCAECRTPTDCPLANAGCSNNACGRCQTDTDCGEGLTCLGTGFNKFCGCLGNAQCTPFGEVCVGPDGGDESCGCESSADCAGGRICDLVDFAFPGVPSTLGQCVIPCNLDGGFSCLNSAWQVTGSPFCNPTTGMCSTCTNSADCLSPTTSQGGPDHPVCLGVGESISPLQNGGGGVCGCSSSDQCPTGTVCDTLNAPRGVGVGSCVPPCDVASGTDCQLSSGSDAFCSSSTGVCSPCQSNAQCQSVYGSLEPVCLAPSVLVGGSPICGCNSSSDCNPGEICDVANGASGECLRSCGVDGGTSCNLLPIADKCDTDNGLCSACLADTDCKARLFSITVQPYCELDAGYCTQCHSVADCTPSHPGCVPQLGCGYCLSNADCASATGLSCDLTTHICRYACTSSFDGGGSGECPAAQPFCDTDAGQCWECRDTPDCAGKGTANTILCFGATHQCNGEGPDAGGAG